jgi:hypothetical protein
MRKHMLLFLGFFPVLVIPFAINLAQSPVDASGVAEASDIETLLEEVEWLQLERTTTLDAEGVNTLTVYYITREIDMVAYRAEMLEVFRVIGATPMEEDFDAIAIIPMADMGSGLDSIEAAIADAADVQPFAEGDISRTAFLESITLTPMEHFDNVAEELAPI